MPLFKALKSIFKKSKKAGKPAKTVKPKKVEPPEALKERGMAKPSVARKKPSGGGKYFKEAYKVLKEPHISEKATVLAGEDKYIFKIYPWANKIETKKAVESLYGVRVKDVNIVNVHRKKKTFRGIEGFKPGYKKAIVTLEEGEKIEIIPR